MPTGRHLRAARTPNRGGKRTIEVPSPSCGRGSAAGVEMKLTWPAACTPLSVRRRPRRRMGPQGIEAGARASSKGGCVDSGTCGRFGGCQNRRNAETLVLEQRAILRRALRASLDDGHLGIVAGRTGARANDPGVAHPGALA